MNLRLPFAVMVSVMLPLAPAVASDVPACASEAAVEYGVPEKVFHALVEGYGWHSGSEESRKNAEDRGQYGSMGLSEYSMPEMARNIGTTVEAIKTDPCENYRGAAWWLMNPAGGNDGDIWEAVNRYFYGHPQRDSYPKTEQIRAIYENL